MKEKYIKYLGKPMPFREAAELEGLRDLEKFTVEMERLTDEDVQQLVVKFYERSSRRIAGERTAFYQTRLKVKPRSVTIDRISNRWGSCNSRREITYHYLISALPLELIDCIVVHELCHIHHMNHDRSFWRKVGSIIPDYKKKTAILERGGVDAAERE